MPKLDKCCFLQCFQREEVITKLDFSNTILSENFPQIWEHERTLEDLCLNSTRLSSLPPQLFYCQGIRVLGVSNNNLENIPNAIGSLRQLQFLNLSRNFISSVPENLKNCKNLTHLDLSCNNLQRLPDAITCLVNLQELFLNETYLEFLPANFGRLINLRILELRLNSLITLPKSMGRLVNLQRMDIGGNEFTELPEVVGDLHKLRELWVDFNQIRRITSNIGKLHDLQHFEANGNLIESLPNEVSNWRNVEVLSICSNNLKNLPQNFGMLRTLVTLKLEFCELIELPDSISSLEQLEEIVVSHNQLERLPETIGLLRKLRFLFADDNNLQALPDELCSCTALTVLSVSRNKLTDLPQNIGHLTKLKVLNLVENHISSLPVSVLSMINLSSLWLSDNQTQPLVPLQYADANTKTRLTCFMLPQNRGNLKNNLKGTKINNVTAHTSPSRRICFANETQSNSEGDCPVKTGYYTNPHVNVASEVSEEQIEPRLMRSPTPYPKELRMMSKYMRSSQKLPQKSPQLSSIKEARIIVNNFTNFSDANLSAPNTDALETASILNDNNQHLYAKDKDNQHRDTYSMEYLNFQPHIPTDVNLYSQGEFLIYSPIQHYEMNNLQPAPEQYEGEISNHMFPNVNPYNNFYDTAINPDAASTLDDDQTALRSYIQQQQFMTPPPYHIARNYTKKTLQDLSNYDSMRNQQYLLEKETSTDISKVKHIESSENVSAQQELTKSFFNSDEQNNLLSRAEFPNVIEMVESVGTTNLLQRNEAPNQPSPTENYNSIGNSLQASESALTSNVKKKSWLFGAHKNPTVANAHKMNSRNLIVYRLKPEKQITLKQENEYPAFVIGKISNEEGIYVLSIASNSSASRLLSVHDKLLEVNGHDFTDISLEEAKHVIATAGTSINIMLSRK